MVRCCLPLDRPFCARIVKLSWMPRQVPCVPYASTVQCNIHADLSSIPAPSASEEEDKSADSMRAAGPGSDDSYVDVRTDYTKNEVAVDYNAGFTGVLAALSGSSNSWTSCVAGNYLIARGNLG